MDKEAVSTFAPLFYLILIVASPLLWNWITKNKDKQDSQIQKDFSEIKNEIKLLRESAQEFMAEIVSQKKDMSMVIGITEDHEERLRKSEGVFQYIYTNKERIEEGKTDRVKMKDDIQKNTNRIKKIEAKKRS